MGCRSTRTEALFVALATVLTLQAIAPRAFAQTPEELQAARDLFQDAYKDEQEHHFTEALDKFTRVARVKESPAVRYRIASVLAQLGRLRQARDGFRALAAARQDAEIADSSVARAAELDKRIPRLSIVVKDRATGKPIDEAHVTVDGAAVAAPTPHPIEVDPGSHLVAAQVAGRPDYERTVTLGDGVELVHSVEIEPETIASRAGSDRTLPVLALAVGGALVLGSTALLVGRQSAIDNMNEACKGGLCPASREAFVEDNRSRAELFGPLGVSLGIVGIAALSVGMVWFLASHSR